MAYRGIEGSLRLGRHRRAVERGLAWLARVRRLAVRSERRTDIQLVSMNPGLHEPWTLRFLTLNQRQRFC